MSFCFIRVYLRSSAAECFSSLVSLRQHYDEFGLRVRQIARDVGREVAGALEHLGAREVLFPGDLPLFTGEDRYGPRFVRTELAELRLGACTSDRGQAP